MFYFLFLYDGLNFRLNKIKFNAAVFLEGRKKDHCRRRKQSFIDYIVDFTKGKVLIPDRSKLAGIYFLGQTLLQAGKWGKDGILPIKGGIALINNPPFYISIFSCLE
jgi:hypothetical protein